MKVGIHNLPEDGISLEFEESIEAFPGLIEMVKRRECEFLSPIQVRLRLEEISDMFHAKGTVETQVRMPCSRCLNDFEAPLFDRFFLAYTRDLPGAEENSPEGDIELKAQEMGVIYFKGEEIDFHDAIQEQVMLAFPIKPLCREGCHGLCAGCGADLNKGDCGCRKSPVDPRFAALAALKKDP